MSSNLQVAAVALLASVGLAASASGVVGIVRMPDLYTRCQSATKNVTMGAIPVLLAVVIARGPLSPFGSRALVIAVLLLVASPMATLALVRAAYRDGLPMWPGAVIDQPDDPAGDPGENGEPRSERP